MPRRKLRIAQIAPIAEKVPPDKYGGTERIVSVLCDGLVERGHDVTLFASGDSKTRANLKYCVEKSLRDISINNRYGTNELTMLHAGVAYSFQDDFDIIHDHLGNLSIAAANLATRPVLMTLHGEMNENCQRLYQSLRNPYLVSISKSQRNRALFLNHVATIYHGLNFENFPTSRRSQRNLLFVGSIQMEKGVHFAIDVAQKLKMPLIIAAKTNDVEKPYFEKYIKPRLRGGYVRIIGEVDEKTRNQLMSEAYCFLNPVTWQEPFGLVMIEAMACGCPVIAFNQGSIPEVVSDGKTGFVVEDVSEMLQKVKLIDKIDRAYCSRYAREKFNAQKMIDAYEEVYWQVLEDFAQRNISWIAPGQETFLSN